MRMQDVYAASGGIVLEKRSWQRRDYRIEELKRWSERLGMIVNIEPSYFPVDVDLASCMVIAAQNQGLNVDTLANAMMRAIWVEDENLADRDTLLRTADRAGYDGLTLLEGAAGAARLEYVYQYLSRIGSWCLWIAVLCLQRRTVLGAGSAGYA
ncbi:2-hydroxychromene-2-carboxylate isomerase [Bradyrhizobium sp. GM5.1]